MEKEWGKQLTAAVANSFQRAKKRNTRLSLRSFATRIGVPKSTLSEIMNGKISFTRRRAIEIVQALDLPSLEKNRLLVRLGKETKVDWEDLDLSHYDLFSDWSYFAVLYFFDLDGEKTIATAARRLGLDLVKTKAIIQVLVAKNLLKVTNEGRITPTGKSWKSTDGIPSESIKKYHLENLKVAERALKSLPIAERDFTSYVFAGNSKQVDFIREEIRKLYERVGTFAEQVSPKDRLYQVAVNFFPLDTSE